MGRVDSNCTQQKNYVSPESDTVKQTFIQVVGKQSGKRFFQLSYFRWKG